MIKFVHSLKAMNRTFTINFLSLTRALVILFLLAFTIESSFAQAKYASNPPVEKDYQVKLYPNPTNRFINVQFYGAPGTKSGLIRIKVVNLLGKDMYVTTEQDFNGAFSSFDMDLQDIPAGIYFMEIYTTINGNTVKETKRITKTQ